MATAITLSLQIAPEFGSEINIGFMGIQIQHGVDTDDYEYYQPSASDILSITYK